MRGGTGSAEKMSTVALGLTDLQIISGTLLRTSYKLGKRQIEYLPKGIPCHNVDTNTSG